MRKKIYNVVEVGDKGKISIFYDYFMMLSILISIIPLWTHYDCFFFSLIDVVTVSIFVLDYILRWLTADIKLSKGNVSFLIYPFTFMAIVDLISILPSISLVKDGFRLFKIFRLFRTAKVFRVFKVFRYSKNIEMVVNAVKKQRDSLIVVGVFAVAYIIITALIMFNAEPETFPTMFDAIYWATVSLTTVGYGDLYATSQLGKIITMISSVLGVGVIALPTGIIMAGYQDELKKYNDK